MRLSVDTGGTFTDLVLEDDAVQIHQFKSQTTPRDPVDGILNVLRSAAEERRVSLEALLGSTSMFLHATTRAINAVLTGTTAKTALLTTMGHRDVLLLREGGRGEPFNWTHGYPDPYIPRSLTFEVPERIGAQGEIVRPLDEAAVESIFARLAQARVEAVAVCLLWSIVNPLHEKRIGELLTTHLPGVPFTLSHILNPTLREYRRASSTAIDASLKPLMATYLRSLETRLRAAGFRGRLLMVTSNAGVLDASDVADAPIHVINSGPSMAPVAGRYYANVDGRSNNAVIADTGGTTYDVTLVRRGRIPSTRETWLGPMYSGHLTGFPAIDVKSIGAGGGSIAWLDAGGLLHVGPQSAGSVPGPVAYGRGGTQPTVTDASVVLGYLDPAYFLGGKLSLDLDAAQRAIADQIAQPLGIDVYEAAAAIMAVTTERMVQSIEEITINQGVDPRDAVLIGGGGAAGLNAVAIGRRLRCTKVIVPEVGAALSAAGALMSDLTAEFAAGFLANSAAFDIAKANALLADLEGKCQAFIRRTETPLDLSAIEFIVEARYRRQVWSLEIPLAAAQFASNADVEKMVQTFHAQHEEIYGMRDERSPIEIVALRARVRCRLRTAAPGRLPNAPVYRATLGTRKVYFRGSGLVDARVVRLELMQVGEVILGPAIIESSFTTVVVDPGASASRRSSGSLVLATGAMRIEAADVSESAPKHNRS
jgi:N-methylhydantoinase A